MDIAFFELDKNRETDTRKLLEKHNISFDPNPLTIDNVSRYTDAEIVSVFIYSQLNKDVLKKMPKLKLIVTRSTGYDHIDLQACIKSGIVVCNVPKYSSTSVAEHTFALLLTISRKIFDSIKRAKDGLFSNDGLKCFELKDKTLGVIGTGTIGKEVIKIANGFGMKVVAYDIIEDKEFSNKFDFEYINLENLLRNSDIITIHCPLTEKTKHLINKDNVNDIKKGSILINTSRGEIVQTEVLLDGLKKGIFSAVGLDVIEDEKELKNNRPSENMKELMVHKNVYITPHNAFNSKESADTVFLNSIQNIKSFLEGNIRNIVQ